MLTLRTFARVLVSVSVVAIGSATLGIAGSHLTAAQAPSGRASATSPAVDRLGVVTRDVSVHIARTIQLPNGATGALVLSVTKGSAAERGGIQPGDVIVRFGGSRVGRVSDLNDIVGKAQPGEALVMLVRVGYFRSVKVTLS